MANQFRRFVYKIKKSKFIKNVMAVASGTAVAQLINIILSPIITRIYSPEIFGVLGLFNSILNVLVPIVAFTLPIAIVLPKDDTEALSIAKASLKIIYSISIITGIVLLISNDTILESLGVIELKSYLWIVPITMLFSGVLQLSQQWAVRNKLFTLKAKTQIISTLFVSLTQLIGGIINPIALILLIMYSMGQGLHALILGWHSGLFKWLRKKSKDNFKTIIKKYSDFPLYRTSEMLINGLSQGLPVIMLTSYYGPSAAGFYTIGKKVLGLPSQIIGQAIGDVFYPHINDIANSRQSIMKSVLKATIALLLIGIIPFGLIFIFGPQIFGFVFGQEWVKAGVYARWLALWTFFVFVNNPSVRTLPVLSEQKFHLKVTIISMVIRVISLYFGNLYYGTDIASIILYSISSSLVNIYLILATIKKCKNFDDVRKST